MASVESGRKNAEQGWSGQSSGIGPGKARPDALRLARELLQDSEGDSDDELLRRLEAVGDDGMLTNAASLLLVGNGRPVLEYRLKGGHQELRPDGELSVNSCRWSLMLCAGTIPRSRCRSGPIRRRPPP